MDVLLYHRAHDLPFGKHPLPAVARFNPDEQRHWKVGIGDESFGNMIASYQYLNKRFEDTWAWPVICGLHLSHMPCIAHVSFAVAPDKVFRHKRSSLAVQITTQPPYEPFCLYGKDEAQGSLWRHLGVQRASKNDVQSEIFWTGLFESELRSLRDRANISAGNMIEKSKKLNEEAQKLMLYAARLRVAFSHIP